MTPVTLFGVNMSLKIVSGAQTGVDRAALDAAMEAGILTGGWCPEGRKAEDGVIPDLYRVEVLPGANYRQRTRRNVIDSDATVIVYFGFLSGGTQQTVVFCINEKKPYLLIDAQELSIGRAALRIRQFIENRAITVLNVAGPRASGEADAYLYTKQIFSRMFNDNAGVWC